MNERIQELAEQVITFRLDPDSNDYEAQINPEDLEMFAELIIRECISKCEGFNQYKLGFQLAKEFREHFGIE